MKPVRNVKTQEQNPDEKVNHLLKKNLTFSNQLQFHLDDQMTGTF